MTFGIAGCGADLGTLFAFASTVVKPVCCGALIALEAADFERGGAISTCIGALSLCGLAFGAFAGGGGREGGTCSAWATALGGGGFASAVLLSGAGKAACLALASSLGFGVACLGAVVCKPGCNAVGSPAGLGVEDIATCFGAAAASTACATKVGTGGLGLAAISAAC